MAEVLFVVTSYDRLLNGDPTGLWLEEFAVPYNAVRAAGHRVTVASIAGGPAPVDPGSDQDGASSAQWPEAAQALRTTRPVTDFESAAFDAIYLPGGHGTVFDMPYHKGLHALLFAFHDAGKPVGCVCHAPAVFAGMRRSDGTPFIAGKTVAGFTDAEEDAVGGRAKVPFLLQTRLSELGAHVDAAATWQAQVVRDGNLLTGQNPQSSADVAKALTDALAGR